MSEYSEDEDMDCFEDLSNLVLSDLSPSFKDRFPSADDGILDHVTHLENHLAQTIKLGALFRQSTVK